MAVLKTCNDPQNLDRKETCAYCGSKGPMTKDHVVAGCFFPKPRPDNLITVPCCTGCNNIFSKDEEYFLALFMHGNAGLTEHGRQLWNTSVGPSYSRGKGIMNVIRKATSSCPLVTPQGIFLGKRMVVEKDLPRIDNVLAKITRGLYYYLLGYPLPNHVKVTCSEIPHPHNLCDFDVDVNWADREWPGVFEYKYGYVKDKPEISIWLFLIWNTNAFVVVTGDPQPE